jgi:hypothetical protein
LLKSQSKATKHNIKGTDLVANLLLGFSVVLIGERGQVLVLSWLYRKVKDTGLVQELLSQLHYYYNVVRRRNQFAWGAF